MRTTLAILVLAFACANPAVAQGVVKQIHWPAQQVTKPMEPLRFVSLRDQVASGEVQLANGEEVDDPDLWAAVVVASRGSGFCTASLIGPNVLLTAAHCVDAFDGKQRNRTVTGTVTIAGQTRPISHCTMSAPYADADVPATDIPRTSEDFAVCEVGGNFSDMTFETLSVKHVTVGTDLLLSGYGCTKIWVFAQQIKSSTQGKRSLRIGQATVEARDVLDVSNAYGSYLRSRAEDYQSIICPGDSGGPVFTGASLVDQNGQRRVVAVNSKVTAVPDGGSYDYLSFLAASSDAAFIQLLADWQAASPARRKICGRDLAPGEEGCRK